MVLSPLPDGGTIAVIAPSSRGDVSALAPGIAALEARGFRIVLHDQNTFEDNQSAGTADQRARTVMDVFTDPRIDAVIAARGGNRSMHLLPLLDWGTLAKHPKPFVGFSDSTALVNAFCATLGWAAFHGPSLSRVHRAGAPELDNLVACLQGKSQTLHWPDTQTLKGGKAAGRLVGGNLSMMAALMGTPYMPDTKGAILFIEDVGDQLSRYDRMLAQLRVAGVLDGLAGLIIGPLFAEGDSSVTPFGFTTDQIVAEHTNALNIPILAGAPIGHRGPLWTLPVGAGAVMDADARTIAFTL